MTDTSVETHYAAIRAPDLPSNTQATQVSQVDIDDLLQGLGSADFDFDMLDDAESPQSRAAPLTRSPSLSPEPYPGAYVPPSPPPAEIPAIVSFSAASGRKLPPPSETAMKRALRIVKEAENDVEVDERVKRPRLDSPPSSSFPLRQPSSAMPRENALESTLAPADPASSRVLARLGEPEAGPSTPSGFRMASGSVAPVPSADAQARVQSLFADADAFPRSQSQPTTMRSAAIHNSALSQSSTSAFQLATGAAAPPLSSDARAAALALFGEDPPSTPGSATGFQTGSGRAVSAPNPDSMARALAIFGETDGPLPALPSPRSASAFRPLSSSTPQRPNSSAFTIPAMSGTADSPARFSTPSRMPLRPVNENCTPGPSTPLSAKLPRRIEIRTPGATPRRIGLGSTPRSGTTTRKGFATPFKTPGRNGPPKMTTPLSLRAASAPLRAERVYEPVFDLAARPNRLTLRAAHLHPGHYSPSELAHFGLPDEIWTLNLRNAILYQFIAEDASTLGNAQAFLRLKHEGCEFVTAKWVDNHWPLILWKLAGQVMAKPDLYDQKWNWYEVLCQLKYRYEREYGAAQRPLVRRIQEHDSSPSLPMVLCVSGIHRPPPVLNEKDEPVPQRAYLDLTDGWYHIRALTDDCLARALDKGRIKIGQKLGIAGAKLESGADGCEVLEAYEKSHLVLAGNSTHLARWDARLGAQGQPFVAALSSLSVDGGPIVLMDIVLDKVFPLAFMSADRSAREAPWNEEEEQTRADAWKDKYEAESARLQEEMTKNLEKIEDLAALLASHAEDVGAMSSEPPDSIDNDFDDLLDAGSKDLSAKIRSLSPSKIVHLARHSFRRVQEAVTEERDQLEGNIKEACPPREVRDFRMVRFSDAREGRKEPSRTGMLNVWEARALADVLVEGRRYLVTNLVPGRNGDWSRGKGGGMREVYLHTRRDTRWKVVS